MHPCLTGHLARDLLTARLREAEADRLARAARPPRARSLLSLRQDVGKWLIAVGGRVAGAGPAAHEAEALLLALSRAHGRDRGLSVNWEEC
ncbi:MAG TPA: hypothetical protein VE975_08890 [Actinomycetota bacterium]|jgi:hypothetical protein|nr:hypothetical protein [Actinomycetota bacterium]